MGCLYGNKNSLARKHKFSIANRLIKIRQHYNELMPLASKPI